ncbi:MAG: geranylgeranyl reductase family protein [Promethearchaeota archaeon]
MEIFDVIVVGAGTGGSIAARFAAQNGLKVCLIDRKTKDKIGDKICGDGVGTEIFNFLNINHPKDEELSCQIKGAKLYSPNLQKCLDMIDPKQAGYVVNRLEFGQRLLNESIDAGVTRFLDNTMALNLIYKKGTVSGLKVKINNGEKLDLKAKIVIDASGFYSPLRKQVQSPMVEKYIPKSDSILCYREIVSFPNRDQIVNDPEFITIILDQERAPGGYIWYFPKNEYSVNIGLGVFMDYKGKVKDYYQQNVYQEFISSKKIKLESSGGGVVPVRRPLWSCVDNGLILIGDAACHVNPLHGGGIDPSMRAGYHAALTALDAIGAGNVSINQLWNFNYKVMTTFGAEYAALDLLRMVLQVLTNEELNFGLSKDLLTSEEILKIAETGVINLSIMDMVKKAISGISNPKLLLDLNYLRIRMNEISSHYKKFPNDINQFEDWRFKTIQIYDKIDKMVIQPRKNPKIEKSVING